MKKRKKPIFLIAVLALLVVSVAAMNSNLLTMPKTANDYARIEAEEQQKAHDDYMAERAKNPPPPKAPGPGRDLVTPRSKDDDEPLNVNVKAVPAIDDEGPQIAAPANRQNKIRVNRASTAPNSGWYYKDSDKSGN